ncbi:hypothetical protein [Microbacterium paludicola]|uniref:hypothetical protein n=1 Tax=Microbacterium paludicola TaxID=300019 RepID=UPI001642AB79|nr:hypothetical protein [Microbacterium paludicola]
MKSQEEKRAEAAERQAAHDGLNAMQKLAKISSRPGGSVKEKGRILADLDDAALDEFD